LTTSENVRGPDPAEMMPESSAGEEERVREAYARRAGDEIRYAYWDPGHLYLMQSRERRVLALLRGLALLPWRTGTILEIGCGKGVWLRDLVRWGIPPHAITGIDLRNEAIEEARALCAPGTRIEQGSGADLSFEDHSFELVLQSMVFSSVLDPAVRQRIATEMLRVLRPGGRVLWYDFHVNNPRNPDVRGVPRAEIERLFPGCEIQLHRVTLAPPAARRLARLSFGACYLLESNPLLCTHYLGTIRRGP
jgi:SAM-dependent methyltransferase